MPHIISTPLIRRIVVETPQVITHMRVRGYEPFPLTNPGHFKAGVYRGTINIDTGKATISQDFRT